MNSDLIKNPATQHGARVMNVLRDDNDNLSRKIGDASKRDHYYDQFRRPVLSRSAGTKYLTGKSRTRLWRRRRRRRHSCRYPPPRRRAAAYTRHWLRYDEQVRSFSRRHENVVNRSVKISYARRTAARPISGVSRVVLTESSSCVRCTCDVSSVSSQRTRRPRRGGSRQRADTVVVKKRGGSGDFVYLRETFVFHIGGLASIGPKRAITRGKC